MAECTACSGSNGATSGGGKTSDSVSAQDIADNLRSASTGPAGLEVDRYAAHVDAAMDAAKAGVHPGVSAADIEAAAMAGLNPRQQGQFQQALDTYRDSAFTTLSQEIAISAPFDLPFGDPYKAIGVNLQGLAVNANGDVIADLPAQSFFEPPLTPYEQAQAQKRADAMRNMELITSGPFSGLFAAGGVAFGAEQRTIEGLAKVGEIVDGLTSPLSPG
jgi:hypothetical protein